MRYLSLAPLIMLVACGSGPQSGPKGAPEGPGKGSPGWAVKKVHDQGQWADNAIVTGNSQAPIP